MKYLLAADFHGNIEAYRRLARVADRVKPDKIVLLGDLFDYAGATPVNNELSRIFYPILAVKGNCDDLSSYENLCVGFRGDFFNEESDGKVLSFTHGHVFGRYIDTPGVKQGGVIFYGHYHVPEIAKVAGITRVCVGSAGRSRAGVDTYCLFDGKNIEIRSVFDDKLIVSGEI